MSTPAPLDVSKKVVLALQENRILVLGTQVLIGFHYDVVFRPKFVDLSDTQQVALALAQFLLLFALAALMAPAPFHHIAYRGDDHIDVADFGNRMAEIALIPFAVAIGIDLYVVTATVAGGTLGLVIGFVLPVLALLMWYAAGWPLRPSRKQMQEMDRHRQKSKSPPLDQRIDQMLTETRVVLPGAQALLGFQFAAVLSAAFGELPASAKHLHLVALAAMAIAMMLLMAPAAFHRVATEGEPSEHVLHWGTWTLLTALASLSLGLSIDLFVVLTRIFGQPMAAISAATAEILMLGLWFAWPLIRRRAPA
jgi:hypothetical protein